MTTKTFKLDSGELCETITFDSGLSFNVTASRGHRIAAYCELHGLEYNYENFMKASDIINRMENVSFNRRAGINSGSGN